jgi:hypothetical protein
MVLLPDSNGGPTDYESGGFCRIFKGKTEGKEVFICQDPATGDVFLSRKPESWEGFFERLQSAEVPEDFLVDRGDSSPQARELF